MDYTIDYERYESNKEELKHLWEAAHIDSLTQLFNRYGMEEWVTRQLNLQSDGQQSALLIIDVDNFKSVNDTFGHMLGDALLVDIADQIRDVFSNEYFCGRIGGDEYQIFAPDHVGINDIEKAAGELCTRIKKKYEEAQSNYQISISIGIAYAKGNNHSYANLYKKADLALYHAKRVGKNGYTVYQNNYTKKIAIQSDSKVRNENHVVQIGESGFSLTKILLDQVIDVLNEIEDPKTAIETIAKLLVDTFDVTRAYASCYSKDGTHVGLSYFYAQDTDQNIKPNLALPAKEYQEKCFNKDGIFFCTDIEKTFEPLKSELKRMGVKTLLQVLVYHNGKPIGTVGINNCGYKRLWLQSEIEVLHTIAKLMTGHIARLQGSLEDK